MTGKADPLAVLDEYELRHLVAHLDAAGQTRDMHRLLALRRAATTDYRVRSVRRLRVAVARVLHRPAKDAEAVNAWHAAHLSIGDAAGFLADVALARTRAQRDWDAELAAGEPAVSIAFDLRYALVQASLRTSDRFFPGPLVVALVHNGLWTRAEGLERAVTLAPSARAEAVVSLAEDMPDTERYPLLRRELEAAIQVKDHRTRVRTLRIVAPRLPPEARERALTAAADAIRLVSNDADRVAELDALAPHLDGAQAQRVLGIARSMTNPGHRADALLALVPRLPAGSRAEVAAEVLAAWRLLEQRVDERSPVNPTQNLTHRARLLAKLAWSLSDAAPTELYNVAWELATEAAEAWRKAMPLQAIALADHYPFAEVAQYLPEQKAAEAYGRALRAALDTPNRRDRVAALTAMLRMLPPDRAPDELVRLVVQHARRILSPRVRVRTLGVIAAYLPEPDRTAALTAALDDVLKHPDYQIGFAEKLGELAPLLPRHLLLRALSAPWRNDDAESLVQALAILLHYLPPPTQPSAVRSLLQIADGHDTIAESPASMVFEAILLAPERWRTRLLSEAIKRIERINDRIGRAGLLNRLRSVHDDPAAERALRRARWARRWVWRRDGHPRVLAAVTADTPESVRGKLAARAFAKAAKERNEPMRASRFKALAQHLTPELTAEMLREVRRMADPFQQLQVLPELIPRLDEPERTRVCHEALAALEQLAPASAARVLPPLAALLPAGLVPAALATVWDGGDEIASALVALAPYLPDDLLEKAAAVTQRMDDPTHRVEVLRSLAPRLPAPRRAELIEELLAACSDTIVDRMALLTPLLRWLPPPRTDELVREALRDPAAIDDRVWSAVAPHLPPALVRGTARDTVLRLAPFHCEALAVLIDEHDPALLDQVLADTARCEATSRTAALAAALTELDVSVPTALAVELVRSVGAELVSRPDLVRHIELLFPLIARLGGEAAMAELANALSDIGHCWR
jgi:hypothetical protein